MVEDAQEQSREHAEDGIQARQEGSEALTPWVGWVLAPAAWALHQGMGYAMIPWLCDTQRVWPYHALTAFAVAICATGAATAIHALHRSRKVYPEPSAQRMRMMALVGLMFCGAAFGGIAVEYVGVFYISVCAGVDL